MVLDDLIPTYLRQRGELAAACAAPGSPGQQEDIDHLSREIADIEQALEASGIDEELLYALLAGRLS